MAARKTTRKKTARKRSARKKTSPTQRALGELEAELPPTLRQFSQRARRGLGRLEKRIEREGCDARRRATRLLRQVSHRLGELEAHGERRWRAQSRRARAATARLLRQLEHAIDPPRPARRRKKTGSKTRSKATRQVAPERSAPAGLPERSGSGI